MIRRLFGMECGRAFCNKWFVFSIILMVLTEWLSSSMMWTNKDFGVDEILDNLFGGTGSATVLITLFPLIPYAMSYAKDMEEHALEFYMIRMDTIKFMFVRFMAVIFSAFMCVLVSFLVYAVLLLCMGYPISGGIHANDMGGYYEFLGSNTTLFLLCYAADRGLSAAMIAACAVFLSVLYPHSFFAFTAPVCIFLLSQRLIFPREIERTWLMPDTWIESVYNSPSGGFATLLCKVGVTAMVCLVYGGFTLIMAKRRWHYA